MKMLNCKVLIALTIVAAAIVLSGLSTLLHAQSTFGSIVGIVTDSSGAVVPGATVTITNLATNNKTTVRTDATGGYRLVDLLPANYKIEVAAKSFKQFVVASAAVQIEGTLRVNATLQVGSENETIEVTAEPALLQTETSAVGYEVEAKQVEQTPLNGRNIENLIGLVPGVVPANNALGSAGENQQSHTANAGFGNYTIGGGGGGNEGQYIDDAPINGFGQFNGGNTVTLIITQDAVQEFRVDTNAVSPQYGRFSGGVVSLGTKSGGNAFHGSVYEYFRNKVLNANNFFNNYSGLPRPIWNQDQFGATASGPIKKDKAFVFFSWEGFKDWLGVPNATNVPTANMQAGVFTRAINDPTGRCPTISGSQPGTTPAPGNNIIYDSVQSTWTVEQGCWDPTSTIMKALWPAVLTPNNPQYNYYVAPKTGTKTNQYTGRVDHNISDIQKFFGRYTYWALQDISPQEFAGSYPSSNLVNSVQTGNSFSQLASHQAVLGDTYTINSTTIANIRLSYNKSFYNQVPPGLGVSESQFGPAFANLSQYEFGHEIPTPSLSGTHGIYTFPAMNFDSTDRTNTYSVIGDVIRNVGKHSLQFGGEERLMQHSGYGNLNGLSGIFTVSNQTTQVSGNSATGDEFASFLLGLMQKATIATGIPTDTYNYSSGWYALDNWKVNQNLTVNLGIRWELPGGLEENHDRATVLQPNAVDPYTGFKGTLVLVNSSQYLSRSMEPVRHDLFSPRVGFAQTLFKNTVIRGGFGLVYGPPDMSAGVMSYNSTVNNQTTTTQNPSSQTATNSAFISNPFPISVAPATAGIIQAAGRNVPNFMITRLGQTISGPIPTTTYPYMEQGNLTVAQELWGKLMLQAGYVGARGLHNPINHYLNQMPDSLISQGAALLANAPCPADQGSASTVPTISVGQCARPYPEYKGLSNSVDYSGASMYNSLQVQGQFRSPHSGLITTSYTWAKTMNYALDSQDVNRGNIRSLAPTDVHQRAIISYTLNLPFGKGQKYLPNPTSVADIAISGWTVNGVTTFQGGTPLALTLNGGNTLSQQFGFGGIQPNGLSGIRPDYAPNGTAVINGATVSCNGNKKTSGSAAQRATKTGWFNVACFQPPGTVAGTPVGYSIGNESPTDSSLRNEGVDNFDFAVVKETKIKELANMQFRMEFFNLFNRVSFAGPGTALNGNNFGLVTATVTNGYNQRQIQASLRITF